VLLVVWGRIGVDGPDGLENALAIQDKLQLIRLRRFGKSGKQVAPDVAFSRTRWFDKFKARNLKWGTSPKT